MFKISDTTTQKTYCISVTKNKISMFKEIIAVCSEGRLKHIGTQNGHATVLIKFQPIGTGTHS